MVVGEAPGVDRGPRVVLGLGRRQAASGRYCRHVAGIVGDASWMKMWAPGVRGFTRGCMLTWWGSRSALRRLHGAHEATMLSQPEPPPLERGITWSTVSDVRAPQYWHCQPSRANTARRVILRLWVSRGMRTYVTSRMTTGRGSEPVAQCSSCVPISTTSALDLSSSTVARRTVHTLMGSNVALSTSTRPPLQRLGEPSESGPCRGWTPSDTDPSGPGGTTLATERSVATAPDHLSARRRGERAQDSNHLGVRAQPVDGPGDAGIRQRALEVEEEHVL